MSTPRSACGSPWGLSNHAANNEPPCGTCLLWDDLARERHAARQPSREVSPTDQRMRALIGVLADLLAHPGPTDAERESAA